MARQNLIALRHKRLVGDFWDDLHCESRLRLEFYRWLYEQRRLSDFTADSPRLEAAPLWWSRLEPAGEAFVRRDFYSILSELLGRPVAPAQEDAA